MLPEGYVLNRDLGDGDDDDDDMTLEEKIEEDREKLEHDKCTPVTPETFAQWKKDRAAAKVAELEAKIAEAASKGKKDKS